MRNRTTTEFLTKSENLSFEFEIYKFLKSKIQREIKNFHRDKNFTLRNRSKIRCLNFNLKNNADWLRILRSGKLRRKLDRASCRFVD